MTTFPELLMAATIPGVEIFSWKSACVVIFYMLNSNFGGASESERLGLYYWKTGKFDFQS